MGDKKKLLAEYEDALRRLERMDQRMEELERQAIDQAERGSTLARELGEAKREIERLRSDKQRSTLGN